MNPRRRLGRRQVSVACFARSGRILRKSSPRAEARGNSAALPWASISRPLRGRPDQSQTEINFEMQTFAVFAGFRLAALVFSNRDRKRKERKGDAEFAKAWMRRERLVSHEYTNLRTELLDHDR